jgi:hypothetical protein
MVRIMDGYHTNAAVSGIEVGTLSTTNSKQMKVEVGKAHSLKEEVG